MGGLSTSGPTHSSRTIRSAALEGSEVLTNALVGNERIAEDRPTYRYLSGVGERIGDLFSIEDQGRSPARACVPPTTMRSLRIGLGFL
jgi:hypothetical protein